MNILILGNNEPAIGSLLEIIEKQGSAFRIFLWSEYKEDTFNFSKRFTKCTAVETTLELEVLIDETDCLYICGSNQSETYAHLLYVLASIHGKKKIGIYRMPVHNAGQGNFLKELAHLKSAEIVFVSPYRFNSFLNNALIKANLDSSMEFVVPSGSYEAVAVFAEILEGLSFDGGPVEMVGYEQEISKKTLQLKLGNIATKIIIEENHSANGILLKHYHSGELNRTVTISEPGEIANMNESFTNTVIDFFTGEIDRNRQDELFYKNLEVIGQLTGIVSNSKSVN